VYSRNPPIPVCRKKRKQSLPFSLVATKIPPIYSIRKTETKKRTLGTTLHFQSVDENKYPPLSLIAKTKTYPQNTPQFWQKSQSRYSCTKRRKSVNMSSFTCCKTLQYTARHGTALQHTAMHCNTLQHSATHVPHGRDLPTRHFQEE